MAASERKRKRRKKALPKLRIPVAKPSVRHKSKKDYKRKKKVKVNDKDDRESVSDV